MIISSTAASSLVSFLGLPNVFPGEDAEYGFPRELNIPTDIDIRLQRAIRSFADLENSLYSDDFDGNYGFLKPENQLSPIQRALASLIDDNAYDPAITATLTATFRSLFAEHCDSYKEWNTLPLNPERLYIPDQNYNRTGTEVDVLVLADDGGIKIGDAYYKSVGKCRKFGYGDDKYAAIVDNVMLDKHGEKAEDSIFHWVKSAGEVKTLIALFYSRSLRYVTEAKEINA